MSVSNLNVLELLGKQVSFTYSHPVGQLVKKGIVTSILSIFLLHLKFL